MFQEMDEALYEDCRVRFEDDEVRLPSSTCLRSCDPRAPTDFRPVTARRLSSVWSVYLCK